MAEVKYEYFFRTRNESCRVKPHNFSLAGKDYLKFKILSGDKGTADLNKNYGCFKKYRCDRK